MRSLRRNVCLLFTAYALGANSDEDEPSDGPSDGHEMEETDGQSPNMSKMMQADMDMYDDEGWHTHTDWASIIIQPETLQPYYMMPMFFGVKTMMTLIIFGYNLKFSKKEPSLLDYPKCFMKFLASVGFIALALNGYLCDYKQYKAYAARTETNWQAICVFMATWVTSSNYVAARAIWKSTLLENPGSLLQLEEPQYLAFPAVPGTDIGGFPVIPGIGWLEPVKHIYLLVLLPYYLPSMIWAMASLCIIAYIGCAGHCALYIGSIKTAFTCQFCGLLTICTLFLWEWPRQIFLYQVYLMIPLYEFFALQLWAQFLAPFIMTGFFAVVLAVVSLCRFNPGDEYGKAVSTVTRGGMGNALKGGTMQIDDKDRNALIFYNKDLVQRHFKGGYTPASLDEEPPKDTVVDDTKLAIFLSVLMDMGKVTVEQMMVLFILRACRATTFEEYVSAAALTVSERHAATYFHHMRTLADESKANALDAVWLLL